MNKAKHICRIILGLIFTVFGLNGFFMFIPVPPPEGTAKLFMEALMATHYFFPFLKATEVACGLLLLTNNFVALALVILMPIILNIVGFHVFVEPAGMPMAIVILAMEIFLATQYSAKYKPILERK